MSRLTEIVLYSQFAGACFIVSLIFGFPPSYELLTNLGNMMEPKTEAPVATPVTPVPVESPPLERGDFPTYEAYIDYKMDEFSKQHPSGISDDPSEGYDDDYDREPDYDPNTGL